MAELLLGPLLSMVKDKASNYLLDKYEVMQGMEEHHETLKRKLPAILDIITDAEKQATCREGPKAWLEALKKVAYEANEVFDEFKYEALRRQARTNGHYGKLGCDVIKIFPTHNRVAFRSSMGNKLRRIVQIIEVLVAEMNTFRFKFQKQDLGFKEWRQTDSIIVDPENIVSKSRDAEKQEIINILRDATTNLTVLPIVGMGGLGKTTLAQLVFNDPQIQSHFQYQSWVCVLDYFDVYVLARKICPIDGDNEKVVKNLKEKLTGKRYLLILDDVWNRDADKWNKLKTCLQHGATGSVILVTTRIEETAQIMGTVEKYDITGLDKRYIREIIKSKAFSLHQSKSELLSMVDQFVQRCCGSPLAAKALGSVLAIKSSKKQWQVVLNKSIISTEESGILPILKLSYDDLQSHVKQCFSFCAVFPKDYKIDVEKLIQLWIANGFIQAQNEVNPESIGKLVFNELASRSFFQDVKTILVEKESDMRGHFRTTCTIHDLMHDVALSIKGKECVAQTEKPSDQIEWLPDTARHLFLSCYSPHKILNDSLKKGSPAIQTLLCDKRMYGSLQHLSKYSSMQALRLCQGDKKFQLKAKHLHHLRYLDLSESNIEVFPEDISILYNLQTLNISRCGYLRQLPRQMKYMISLRHLYTHGCEKLMGMPPDIRKVTSLQTLTCFVAGTGSHCSNVEEIQSLNLQGQLELSQLENITAADAKAAHLRDKKELTELILRWTSGREEDKKQHDLEVLDGLQPNDKLQVLLIYFYGGTSFPKIFYILENLVELFLFGCDGCEKLPLCNLPALQVLHLEELIKLRWLCDADTSFSLPNLKKLKLTMLLDLERWWEIEEQKCQQVMFPNLVELVISNCRKLTALPGQQTFLKLESVYISGSPKFTTLLEAPKLSVLDISYGNQQMSLCAAKCIAPLTKLRLHLQGRETSSSVVPSPVEPMYYEEKCNHKSPMVFMELNGDNLFFSLCALSLWTCFVELQQLHIRDCDVLVHWPEKEFESLVSLVTLQVKYCKNLTGYAHGAWDSERSQLLPRLEDLEIMECVELEEVLNVPGSIKKLVIMSCPKIILPPSIFRKQQGMGVQSEPAAAMQIFLNPLLEELTLDSCDSLSGVLNIPPSSLKKIRIENCKNLESIAWQLDDASASTMDHRPSSPTSIALRHFVTHLVMQCVEII